MKIVIYMVKLCAGRRSCGGGGLEKGGGGATRPGTGQK
jgi:hypothetical protein